jgi:hypothetical protein
MRSHRNENGHILLVVPREVIGPFRNALQKLAGGIDFFALDVGERDSLDHALRHLWNPGDDAPGRDKTVPIDILALAMRDHTPDESKAEPPPDGSVLTRISTRERIVLANEDGRHTVELNRADLPLSPVHQPVPPDPPSERNSSRGDGYRAPTKGRHTDVSR